MIKVNIYIIIRVFLKKVTIEILLELLLILLAYICAIWQREIKFFDIVVKFVEKFCGMELRRSQSGIPQNWVLNLIFILVMINNSSLQKWDRLKQKQLDTQFVNCLIQGMSCSQFEAKSILNAVYEVYQPFFDNTGAMKPGQIFFEVVSIENGSQKKLSECKMVSVVLTLDAGEENLLVKEQQGVQGLRRHRLERMVNEAFQQGGLLTVEDLANRLLNCGERTICRDIKAFKDQGIVLPLRSTIRDMGKSVTHRALIVREWLSGKEYTEIARATHHSIDAVANYIDKFKRVVCLAKNNYEINTIAFLVKLSPSLAQEYYDLYRTIDAVPHRKEELDELIKKIYRTIKPAKEYDTKSVFIQTLQFCS